MIRFGKSQRGIPGEDLYEYFFADGHMGIEDMMVKIIDKRNVNHPTNRKGFLVCRLNSFVPSGV